MAKSEKSKHPIVEYIGTILAELFNTKSDPVSIHRIRLSVF